MRAVGRMRLEGRNGMGHWATTVRSPVDTLPRLGAAGGVGVRQNGVDYPQARPC